MPAPFVLGVVPGVTPDRWIGVWRERMPDVPLRVVPVEDAEAGLRDGATMVFARLPIEARDLHVIPLWEETPVVVAAKDHPVKLFDAVTEADLAAEELYPGWDDAVLDVVAAGHGIARMPQSVYRATGRRDVIARPITDAPPTRVGLVWSPTVAGPLVDEFIGIVRGRTANSSRGDAVPPAAPTSKPQGAGRKQQRPDRKPPKRPSGGKRRR